MNYSADTPIWQLKKQMCEIGSRIWQRGYCAGNEGNHSVRVGEDRVLCTPTGISKGFLTPDDICVVDMDGEMVEANAKGRKRTSEVKVHLAIYKHREDIDAVIHSHPPHATTFAICQIPVPEGIHPEAEVFLGRVPVAQYATPSTHQLPDSILPLIGPETNTVLMGNHGSVSFSGKGLIDAYYKLEILDAYCRILLLTRQLGPANVLDAQQMTELLKVKEMFGMKDDRLTCAPEGCVGDVNQPFFASFDVRPTSAACSCDGGEAQTQSTRVPQTSGPVAPGKSNMDAGASSGGDMESLVQAITDQIVKQLAG